MSQSPNIQPPENLGPLPPPNNHPAIGQRRDEVDQIQVQEKAVDHWASLFSAAELTDKAQCAAWKDEVQNILIFAALFSAVVAGLLVGAYAKLESDPNDTTVALLTRLVILFENPQNVTLPDPVPKIPFKPEPSSVRVSVYWSLSLVLSLGAALIGVVCLQWLREHRSYPGHWSAEQKFAVLQMRMEMQARWHVPAFIASLPVLIMLALFLFFVGLADFLISLNIAIVTIPVITSMAPFVLFVAVTTTIPTFYHVTPGSKHALMNTKVPVPSPFKSFQAEIFRAAVTQICKPILFIIASRPNRIPEILFPAIAAFRACVSTSAIISCVSCISEAKGAVSTSLIGAFMGWIATPVSFLTGKLLEYIFGFISHLNLKYPAVVLPRLLKESKLDVYLDWTDLDVEWILIRRLCSFNVQDANALRNLRDASSMTIRGVGPSSDQIQGLRHLCKLHSSDQAMLESAYHCFQLSLSNGPSDSGSSAQEKLEYRNYKSLVQALWKEPSLFTFLGPTRVPPNNLNAQQLRDLFLLYFVDNIPLQNISTVADADVTKAYLRILYIHPGYVGLVPNNSIGMPSNVSPSASDVILTSLNSFLISGDWSLLDDKEVSSVVEKGMQDENGLQQIVQLMGRLDKLLTQVTSNYRRIRSLEAAIISSFIAYSVCKGFWLAYRKEGSMWQSGEQSSQKWWEVASSANSLYETIIHDDAPRTKVERTEIATKLGVEEQKVVERLRGNWIWLQNARTEFATARLKKLFGTVLWRRRFRVRVDDDYGEGPLGEEERTPQIAYPLEIPTERAEGLPYIDRHLEILTERAEGVPNIGLVDSELDDFGAAEKGFGKGKEKEKNEADVRFREDAYNEA